MHLRLLIGLLLYPLIALGQPKTPTLELETAIVLSNGHLTPFWLISNRQGKVFPHRDQASISLLAIALPDTGKVFDLHYGAEVYGRQGRTGDLWLHQLYAAITYKDVVELCAGLWE